MKIAKKVSSMKVVPTQNFHSKIYPSIVPKLKKDTVSKVTHHDEVAEMKEVYVELNEIKQHYLNILNEDYGENAFEISGAFYTLIYNILIVERKLIAIKKRRYYEKLKSKNVFRDVDKKMKVMEKLAFEVEELIQELYASEQVWSTKLETSTKKEKREILSLAQVNYDSIDQLSKGITNKWQTYKKVHNAMEKANANAGLYGKKKVTVDMLRDIIKQQEQDSSNEDLSVS